MNEWESIHHVTVIISAFALAGMVQILWFKSSLSEKLAIPLDGGLRFRGRRVFGDHKTIRGIILLLPVLVLLFVGAGLLKIHIFPNWRVWDISLGHWALSGLAVGIGYSVAELPNSFFKRQLSIAPGSHASERPLRLLFRCVDRLDSTLGVNLAIFIVLPTSVHFHIIFSVAALALHASLSQVMYWLGLKGRKGAEVVSLQSGAFVEQVGNKAWSLGQLMQLDMKVPAGIVVTRDLFSQWMDDNQLAPRVQNILQSVDHSAPRALIDSSRKIEQLVADSPISVSCQAMIHQWAQPLLSGGSLIVRSSAIGEDSADASYAGMFESVNGVRTLKDLDSALKQCWSSYWSPRVLAYQQKHGGTLDGMGVIIQRYVDALWSGVLFTQCPPAVSGEKDAMLVEYCAGDGGKLVQGHINPGRILLMCDGTVRMMNDRKSEDRLPRKVLELLMTKGQELERICRGPQDIEWVVGRDGTLHLVQCRPIVDSNRKFVIWSNANINENFPDAVCPLLYDLVQRGYYYYFRNLALEYGLARSRVQQAEPLLRTIVGLQCGRLYYNLSSIHACLRTMPFGDVLVEYFNRFIGTDRVATQELPKRKRSAFARPGEFFEVLRIIAATSRAYWRSERRICRFEARADQFHRKCSDTIVPDPDPEGIAQRLREFMHIRCHRWVDAGLADVATMCTDGYLRQLLASEWKKHELDSLHHTLLQGVENIVSTIPARRLWQMITMIRKTPGLRAWFRNLSSDEIWRRVETSDGFPSFCVVFLDYIEKWGFRCSKELMLLATNYQDRPQNLIDLIKHHLNAAPFRSPQQTILEKKQERIKCIRRIMERWRGRRIGPWPGVSKTFVFRKILKWAHMSIGFRERARCKQAQLYADVRRLARAAGSVLHQQRLIEDPQDVFFFSWDELQDVLSSRSSLSDISRKISSRRAEYDRWRPIIPPVSIEAPLGETVSFADVEATSGSFSASSNVRLTGCAASGGVIRAPAAVLEDPAQSDALTPGCILVTKQTDPGWTLLFGMIGGIVIERGGMLSHGAIVAREFGLPCVVGVEGASSRIRSGQILRVDGGRGIVDVGD